MHGSPVTDKANLLGTYGPLAWLALVVGVWAVSLWTTPFDSGYTAGEMYDHLLSWRETGVLYPSLDEAPLRVLNYPPLVFALVRLVAAIGLPPLAVARLGTLISLIVSVLVLYRWVKAAGAGPSAAIAVVGLSAASFGVLHAAGQFRVELPAVALTLVGLYMLHAPHRARTAAVAGVALALACFAKHTQVLFPLVGAVWLARYHRNRLIPFLGGVLPTALVGVTLMHWVFGPEAWRHLITYTVGTYSVGQLVEQFASFVVPWCVFIVLAIWLARNERQERSDLRWWYFVASSVWLLAAAREGSSSNYFIDWAFATLLWIGPWLGSWLVAPSRRAVPLFVSFALAAQILGAGIGVAVALFINVAALSETRASLPALCEAIPPDQEIVPIENPGLARACGRRSAIHPFIISSLAIRGLWDESPFVEDLATGTYPVVVLPFDPANMPPGNTDRWTPAMLEALGTNYTVGERVAGWNILHYDGR